MIRVALIGYGYAGRTFHAPLIRATSGLEIIAVSSSRPDRVTADLPDLEVLPSPIDACIATGVDLAVIATRTTPTRRWRRLRFAWGSTS